MKILIFTEPISLNSMYRGRRFLTNNSKATKLGMQGEIRSQVNFSPTTLPVALTVRFFFKDKRRRDIDSHLKCLLDSFTGLVYEDDSQIIELHVYKQLDKQNPRTEIEALLIT